MQRLFHATAVAMVLTAVLAAPAHADVAANVTSPRSGEQLTAPTPVEVRVTRALLDPEVSGVSVRISADGREPSPGTQELALSCLSGCGSTESVWGGIDVEPDLAPFADDESEVCNGRWFLQPRASGGSFGAGVALHVSAQPTAVPSVVVTANGTTPTVSWTSSPTPDVTGYRVERSSGGTWTEIAAVGPTVTSARDVTLASGTYRYRVVALRADGRSASGEWLGPCKDTGRDLATASAPREITLRSASGSSGGSSSGSGGESTGSGSTGTSGGSGSTGSTGGQAGATTPTSGGAEATGAGETGETAGETTGSSAGSTAQAGSGPRTQVAAPPSASRGGPNLSAPRLPDQPGAPAETYYGEDDGFTDELDYGEVDPVTGLPIAGGSQTIRIPGGMETFFTSTLDQERVLKPIAGGLILVTLALHLRRWTREQG